MKEKFIIFNNIQELFNISSFLFDILGGDKESLNHMWHAQFQYQFLPKIWSVFASGPPHLSGIQCRTYLSEDVKR